jgi:hypothetical protein
MAVSQKFDLNRIALVKGVNMSNSVFEKHKEEIELYQRLCGPVIGSLLYATSILSDIQEMRSGDGDVVQELNEVKELLGTAMQSSNTVARAANIPNAKYEICATPSDGWGVLKLILPAPIHWLNIANGTYEALEALKGYLEKKELIISYRG